MVLEDYTIWSGQGDYIARTFALSRRFGHVYGISHSASYHIMFDSFDLFILARCIPGQAPEVYPLHYTNTTTLCITRKRIPYEFAIRFYLEPESRDETMCRISQYFFMKDFKDNLFLARLKYDIRQDIRRLEALRQAAQEVYSKHYVPLRPATLINSFLGV